MQLGINLRYLLVSLFGYEISSESVKLFFLFNENSMKIVPIIKVFTKETAGPTIKERGINVIKKNINDL